MFIGPNLVYLYKHVHNLASPVLPSLSKVSLGVMNLLRRHGNDVHLGNDGSKLWTSIMRDWESDCKSRLPVVAPCVYRGHEGCTCGHPHRLCIQQRTALPTVVQVVQYWYKGRMKQLATKTDASQRRPSYKMHAFWWENANWLSAAIAATIACQHISPSICNTESHLNWSCLDHLDDF